MYQYQLIALNLNHFLLAGTSVVAATVVRTQLHSTIPSGSFELIYTDQKNDSTLVLIPFNANSQYIQNVFQSNISPDLNVSQKFDRFSFLFIISLLLVRFTSPALRVIIRTTLGQ